MNDKQQEFTELLEFIEASFDIILQKYQIEYLKYLIDKNSVFVSGRNMGKTALLEKYVEFKQKYPNGKIETATKFNDSARIFDQIRGHIRNDL